MRARVIAVRATGFALVALLGGPAFADVLVVGTDDPAGKPLGIELGAVEGVADVHVSEGAAEEKPSAAFISLAEVLARQGLELVSPLQGSVRGSDGTLTSVELDLVVLRRLETPLFPDGELIDVVVRGIPGDDGVLRLEVKGYSRARGGDEPEFSAILETRLEP